MSQKLSKRDPQAVQTVVEDGADQGDLHRNDERPAIELDRVVVDIAAEPDQQDVENVDQQEADDAEAGRPGAGSRRTAPDRPGRKARRPGWSAFGATQIAQDRSRHR